MFGRMRSLMPFDMRELGPTEPVDGIYRSTRRAWFKTAGSLPDDPALHACVLTFASDMGVVSAARVPVAGEEEWARFMGASLDHAVWFHRPIRADEWVMFDLRTVSSSGARGLAAGTMHTQDGQARRVGRARGADPPDGGRTPAELVGCVRRDSLGSMTNFDVPITASMLEFLSWVAERSRTYAEAMETWPTSCPRSSVWEDASIAGYIALREISGESCVFLTRRGAAIVGTGREVRRNNETGDLRIVKDLFWCALAGFFLYYSVTRTLFGGIDDGQSIAAFLVGLGLSGVVTYWIVVGAIRRTSWAQQRRLARIEADLRDGR